MIKVMRGLWLALLAVLIIAPLSVAPAQAEEPKAEESPIARFSGCVRGGGQGSILMLFDRSGSLKDTDPEDARVTAAKYLVEQLAKKLGGLEQANVQLSLAGFDTKYERSLDWTDLNEGNLGNINAELDKYQQRNDGIETDYWAALDGVRRELAGRQESEGNQCALVVWFSDGGFAIGVRQSEAAIQNYGGMKAYAPENKMRTQAEAAAAQKAGEEDLCRAGGVADQLRSMDVVSVGIGLSVEGKEDFELMKGFTSGEGMACGNIKEPKPGEFLMATDIDELLLAFDSVLDDTPTNPTTNELCVDGSKPCAEGTRTFVLDSSINKVQALAQLPIDDGEVLIQTRDGKTIQLTRDGTQASLPGAKLSWQWLSERSVNVELQSDGQSDQWAGPWGLVFTSPTKTDDLARSTLRLYGDIVPVLANAKDLDLRVGGKPVELQIGLTDHQGQMIDASGLSEETFLNVSATTSDGKTSVIAEGLTPADLAKPLSFDPGKLPVGVVQLHLVLDVTTHSWNSSGKTIEGTHLEPIVVTTLMHVSPPEEFPTIASKISFGETETGDPVTVKVPLQGEGCVWLGENTQFTGYPKGLNSAKLTSPAKDEGSCTSDSLELTLDPGGIGNGALVGSTTVWLKSPSAAQGAEVKLDFDLQMSRPASQPVLWGTLIGVMLLGVAIPLGFLYLVKFMTAKIPGNAVLAGQVRGPVDDLRSFTDDGLTMDVASMNIVQLVNNRKHVDIAGVRLKAKTGLALTEPGYVLALQPGRAVGGRSVMVANGEHAKLPLAVQGNWTVALDPDRPLSGDVVVTVFTSPGAHGLTELLADVRANLRDAVAKLREGLPPEPTPPSADPWGTVPSPAKGGADAWATPPSSSQNNPWAIPASKPSAPPMGRQPGADSSWGSNIQGPGNQGGWASAPTPNPSSTPGPNSGSNEPSGWQNPSGQGLGGTPGSGGASW